MNDIAELLGWLIIFSYGLTVMNYVVKFINKKWGTLIRKNPTIKKVFMFLMKLIVRYHKLYGFLTILFILAHFLIQFTRFGINLTGAIAASIMIFQVLLGLLGAYVIKKRTGLWFILHRFVAIILFFPIMIHIL